MLALLPCANVQAQVKSQKAAVEQANQKLEAVTEGARAAAKVCVHALAPFI